MMGVVIVWMAGLAGWARTGLGGIVRSHCAFRGTAWRGAALFSWPFLRKVRNGRVVISKFVVRVWPWITCVAM